MGKFSKHFQRRTSSSGSPIQNSSPKNEDQEEDFDDGRIEKSGESEIVSKLSKVKGTERIESMEEDRLHYGKHSRLQDLLSSFKEDVIQMRDVEASSGGVTSRSSSSYPFQQEDSGRQFTRVSPQKLAATLGSSASTGSSKWKKAVRMSKTVITRPKEAFSRASKNFPGRPVSLSHSSLQENAEDRLKMSFLFKAINHSSCIFSGILTGLLLWSSINAASLQSENESLGKVDSSLLFFYTTTVILMYVCLVGYILRLYTCWVRINPALLGHVLVILSILLLHYLHKSYDLLILECKSYRSEEENLMTETPGFCGSVPFPGRSSTAFLLILLSKIAQTCSAFFLTVYFHFSPYAALKPILVASQIKSTRLLSPQI